jgi:transposase
MIVQEREVMMRSRRKFSLEFKTPVVLQRQSGEKSLAEVCREHQLTAQMVGNWKQQFLAHAKRVFEGDANNNAEQARIAELETVADMICLSDAGCPILPACSR